MALQPLPMPDNPFVFVVIDPAAGGQQSDYAIVSIVSLCERECVVYWYSI